MPRRRSPLIESTVSAISARVPAERERRPWHESDPSLIARVAVEQFGAIQKPKELADLLHLLKTEAPQRVIEIGTARGGTLFSWCQVAAPEATLVSIDLPEGPYGGGYRLRDEWRFSRELKRSGQRVVCLRRDSGERGTRELALEKLGA